MNVCQSLRVSFLLEQSTFPPIEPEREWAAVQRYTQGDQGRQVFTHSSHHTLFPKIFQKAEEQLESFQGTNESKFLIYDLGIPFAWWEPVLATFDRAGSFSKDFWYLKWWASGFSTYR